MLLASKFGDSHRPIKLIIVVKRYDDVISFIIFNNDTCRYAGRKKVDQVAECVATFAESDGR